MLTEDKCIAVSHARRFGKSHAAGMIDVYADSLDYENDLYLIINRIYNITNIPFVIIIDEWDCVRQPLKQVALSM